MRKFLFEETLYDITPERLAKEFITMDSEGQARFLNFISSWVDNNWYRDFCFQAEAITNEECLSQGARSIMRILGEYSNS